MNIEVRDRNQIKAAARVGLAIADGDIHPRPKAANSLDPFLSERWRRHYATYGALPRHGYQKGPAYPKGQPDACRRDTYLPDGGKPGTDVAFMAAQHLDPNNVELGILNAITPSPGAVQNLDFGAALARAMNEWQVAEWTEKDARLKASIVVPYEDGRAAAAEIEHWAGSPHFVQVLLMSRTAEPLGQRRYWPIYEAAARNNLPIGIHAFGYGGYPVTGSGWPSYYIEEMSGHAQCCQALLSSMVLEGVFEHFPSLKVVLIESGFAWLPALSWRLDRNWKRMRDETPHLKRLPSEYIREHVWMTTQPMEEPERRKHLTDVIDWIGIDRLMFATDYPHWDF
ncbi:MAG: amidohydrolase, partial [Hyphomicrobiaceae bacterium]|nr:amidohydrolase [Hyphomicrobiaceae bacterium]